ncbi:hypothetical protein GLOTRDRAFT_129426 [Gloeophyllum trabeum ATCC 11539]|uniref:Uncharacterized protein n=1 Tax=Gloeophyllum trabeum (strain ATCC 11539 / FP-39264 / Madison 617) TaxID=670483 RepID=S7RQG7_GLOTA|nr:uncharacterized protein GLOTRDRAFT_129426 [Gloeophyllum trabeum ATCC 11539]EPQ55134.1 hypothetical protein GLOTRDRAFT_129426 [Gloeophyllum trabeum ATCC 11539]
MQLGVSKIRRLCECYNFILLALVLRHRDEPQMIAFHNNQLTNLSTENLLEFEDEFLSLIREYYEDKENWMPFEALSTLVPNEQSEEEEDYARSQLREIEDTRYVSIFQQDYRYPFETPGQMEVSPERLRFGDFCSSPGDDDPSASTSAGVTRKVNDEVEYGSEIRVSEITAGVSGICL